MTNPQLCPLCQEANHCALAENYNASGNKASGCWCMQAKIAPEILQKIPPAQRNQTCICARCAQHIR